ncbi:SPOR domain-containing protein [Rhodobacteraceae bacterium XHP0102]|nr:SPOR domain-containing protein [Rhodobacteraceae bacterium XHP0102]
MEFSKFGITGSWRAVVLVAALGLAGCQTALSGDGAAAVADSETGTTRLVERDVEAPDVFQVTEDGLWDGRPSLGGVWVAHPSATDPERVIIRNDANGRFVIGALFRRERDNPGPALQVSSDAAQALGLLAGAPAILNVTALRREEVPEDIALAAPAEGIAPPNYDGDAVISQSPIDAGRTSNPSATAAPPAPIAAAPAATTALERPFVQIGIFAVQENANNTAQALRNSGLQPTIYDQTSNGRRFWRVVVGPAATSAERANNLEVARRLGFADAYVVTN